MTSKQELQLLKSLAAGDRRRISAQVISRELDVRQLGLFLEREHLADYFLAILEDLGLLKLFPTHFRDQLQWQREGQRQRRTRLGHTQAQLQHLFRAAGIEMMVLKGLPLAGEYWGGTEHRFVWDLDLLVRPVDLEKAKRLLVAEGFTALAANSLPSPLLMRLTHAVEYVRGETAVDLHWAFRRRPGFNIDYAAVWQRSSHWQHEGVDYRIPAAGDTLLIMLLGIAQDAERGHCTYRKLWDVYLWLRRERAMDWDAFAARCEREGVATLCLHMLALTLQGLGCAGEFPELEAVLSSGRDDIALSPVDTDRILGRSRQHPGNRLWFARLQAVSPWRYLIWWTLTAPMRYLLGRNI